jgi:hypothetical protein
LISVVRERNPISTMFRARFASKLRPIYELYREGPSAHVSGFQVASVAQLLHGNRYNGRAGPLIDSGRIIGAIGCFMARRLLTIEGKDLALLLNSPLLLVAYRRQSR